MTQSHPVHSANVLDDLPPSAVALRRDLTRGIEHEVVRLRRLDAGRRALDFVTFPGLWIAGAVIGLYGMNLGPTPTGWTLRILGIAIAALALNAFMMLMHQGMHQLLARGKAANRTLAGVFAAPLFISATAYFVLHIEHHRYLGSRRDPDEYRNYGHSPRAVWLMHWMRLLAGTYVYIPAIAVLGWRRAPTEERPRIAVEYAILLAAYVLVFALVPIGILAQVWLIPAAIMGHLTAIRAFSQHGLTDVHDPYLNSRTLRVNRFTAFFMLNENYHLEHHLFPDVPSYNLPALHARIWPKLPRVVTGTSYSEFLMHFLRRQRTMDESPAGLEVRAP